MDRGHSPIYTFHELEVVCLISQQFPPIIVMVICGGELPQWAIPYWLCGHCSVMCDKTCYANISQPWITVWSLFQSNERALKCKPCQHYETVCKCCMQPFCTLTLRWHKL